MSDKNHEHEHDHECGCGCGHDHEEQLMTLVLDDNTEMKCHVLGVFEADNDKEYIALLPEDEEDVLIYGYIENDSEEGFELINIESDEEYDIAAAAFEDVFLGEDEDFDDEEEVEEE